MSAPADRKRIGYRGAGCSPNAMVSGGTLEA